MKNRIELVIANLSGAIANLVQDKKVPAESDEIRRLLAQVRALEGIKKDLKNWKEVDR